MDLFHLFFGTLFKWLFSWKMTPAAPKWSPNGARMVPRSWFLRFPWNLVSVQHNMVLVRFSGFWRPRPAPGTCFFRVLLRPPKHNTNSICLEILVSFWVPVRGGITDFCGLLAHQSLTQCEFSKFTPTKHMVFEAISGASAHLGPPGPKMGPGHPPRSPNDPQNMIFYPFLSLFGRF